MLLRMGEALPCIPKHTLPKDSDMYLIIFIVTTLCVDGPRSVHLGNNSTCIRSVHCIEVGTVEIK